MRTCFVPFCDIKHKDQPNRTMFLVPKDPKLFALWSEALPKVRELKSTDKVCCLHFKPDEVLYTFDHTINGQIVKIKRDRPRLKPNAIPCLEVTTKEESLSLRAKNRLTNQSKNVKISDNTENKFKLNLNMQEPQQANDSVNICIKGENEEEEKNEQEEEEEHELHNVTVFEYYEQATNEHFEDNVEDLLAKETNKTTSEDRALPELASFFNFLYENVYEISMPTTLWGIHLCPQRSFICFSCLDALKMQITKMLIIKVDGSVQLLIEGNLISLKLLRVLEDLDSLTLFLNKIDVGRLCFGKSTNANCDFIVEPKDDNCWFTDANEQVFLCKFCLPLNKVIS